VRILGIDFGEKRIGLAVSDPLGFTAQGLETLEMKGHKDFFERLRSLCDERGIGEVVIGLPVNMNGSLGPKAKEILQMLPEMEKALARPVKTWDERLSSRQAGRFMIEAGLSREKQKQKSDELAATLILQNYLESRRS
jgi:putative holliday junction resolvase